MTALQRRARAALSMGLLWGGAGMLAGFAIELVLNILPGPDLLLGVDVWPAALGMPAFIVGVWFSLLLAFAERNRKFGDLKLPRVTTWGAVSGLALGAIVGLPAAAVGALTVLSGASAAGSLALARRADAPKELKP